MADAEIAEQDRRDLQLVRLEQRLTEVERRLGKAEDVLDALRPVPEQLKAMAASMAAFQEEFRRAEQKRDQEESERNRLALTNAALEATRSQQRMYLLFTIIGLLIGGGSLLYNLILHH